MSSSVRRRSMAGRGSKVPGDPRRERGLALDRRPRRDAGVGRWRLRPRRDDRQPLRAGRGPAYRPGERGPGARDRGGSRRPMAHTRPSSPPSTSWTARWSRSRSTSVGGSPARRCGRCSRRTTRPPSSPSSPPAGRRTSASSTTSPRSPRSAASTACGSTSTVRMAAPALPPSVRPLYAGIEYADSFIVDPHKWLFAPSTAAR